MTNKNLAAKLPPFITTTPNTQKGLKGICGRPTLRENSFGMSNIRAGKEDLF